VTEARRGGVPAAPFVDRLLAGGVDFFTGVPCSPLVVMQNSGVGVSLNALGSLHLLYEMPCLLLVTWRGYDGKDAPEHLVMGAVLPRVLDLFDIPRRAPTTDTALDDVTWAVGRLRATRKPVALLVRPGLLE